MAALSAANQARISQNTRNTLPTTGGISSGPYLGVNSHTYPPGGHDLMSNANPHPNFQNNYGTPNSVPNASFPDPRNQAGSSSLKQRQQGFLQGLAGLMAKRNTPLPPSLTGIPFPNYDPSNTLWSIIEPSSEVGSFRLAGRDVDLFKLWGLVFQQGGGHTV
jgi:SWI/SNF chromatin-remodeling complex subunit SWI1